VFCDRLLQRKPGHVGGREPRRLGVRVSVENLRRVQAVNTLRGDYFLAETVTELLVVAEFRPDYLDGERPTAPR
jgi:hypothetical protein